MYSLAKKILFKLEPELAHDITLGLLNTSPRFFSLPYQIENKKSLSVSTRAGQWSFPLGIAAGLDKQAKLITFFSRLGVGALEVGTVTPLPQKGNPKPRLFRYPADESILNRMGFNGPGVDIVQSNISKHDKKSMILGINIGKNKITPNDKAIEDYLVSFEKLKHAGEYFVVNVSSPNTPGLRELQEIDFLNELFDELMKVNSKNKPIYLKIAPDLNDNQVKEISEFALSSSISGMICTNTTVMENMGKGGVSGELLYDRAKRIRRKVLEVTRNDATFDVIGVGGVSEFSHLWDFWQDGGKVMQLYSSLVFKGPGIFKSFQDQILSVMSYFGFTNLEELIRVVYEEKLNLPKNY